MEKNQYELCLEVFHRLDRKGILQHTLVIGSWCLFFYRNYFKDEGYRPAVRTRDIDFLLPLPVNFKGKEDIPEILKELGFITGFKGNSGYIILQHPDLLIEFLVPEKGRGSDKPYPIPQLGINAQPLRYLHFLQDNAISLDFEGMKIRVPHPAAYALHKFIIFKRRAKPDKRDRDIEGATRVFRQLLTEEKADSIRIIFGKMHRKWQITVIRNLKSIGENEIAALLQEYIA